MSQILYLDSTSSQKVVDENIKLFDISLRKSLVRHFRKLVDLLIYVSVVGASELDLDYPTVVIINEIVYTPNDPLIEGASNSPLNTLTYDQMHLLLSNHYKHLNILPYKLSTFSISLINQDIENYNITLKNRILRMKSWVGLNNHNTQNCPCLHSMTNCLNIILQKDYQKSHKSRHFVQLINSEIDFIRLLTLPKQANYYMYCIGNWGFIAHELTCDELTFCAFKIFKIAFSILEPNDPLIIDDNSILSFLFSLRDSYRGGNSFHNFRHAVDVLQATFYFLLRINALPKFPFYTEDLSSHPNDHFTNKILFNNGSQFDKETSILNPIQTLALLVSSVGHDVGHPGLTNPFLINNESPIAKIYSNQSVLENYHSTIFQDILSYHWPVFLDNSNTKNPQSPLNTKVMQVQSILATDMANHFEYLSKIDEISILLNNPETRSKIKDSLKQTNVILSMIIKCADISNVARPLLISTKWGFVLAREFNEINQLDENLNKGVDVDELNDPRLGPYFPPSIEEALTKNPSLPKGQLFFIKTFAEALFKEVAIVFPELAFGAQIVNENKLYWEDFEARTSGGSS